METIDVAIIGAGIIGITTGLEILKRDKNLTVVIFEKELFYGEHTSSRNSGVLHSGIYYSNGSLKHQFCIEGNSLWSSICHEYSIAHKKIGKFIFAQNDIQGELNLLIGNGKNNNVPGVSFASKGQLLMLNDFVSCDHAIWCPSTSVIDQAEAMKKLLDHFETLGGIYLKAHEVVKIARKNSGYVLEFKNGLKVASAYLINAAGLGGIHLRTLLNLWDLKNYYVKGNYIKLSKKLADIDFLLYPLPEKNLKGLGIHLTIDIDSNIKFGPDTQDVSEVNYSISSDSRRTMVPKILSMFKNIDETNLEMDYCGIRPKIKLNNEVFNDFWIKETLPNYIECLGIESPGFTAAPAIAIYINKLRKANVV